MRRSTFVALSTALAVTPGAVFAQELTQIRIASAPDEDVIGALWGVESGAFRKAGLDVVITRANSGAAVAASVAGGAIDIGKSSLISLLAARNRGLPFILVAPSGIYTSEAPAVGMIVTKDSPIKSGKDLNGKTLAVPALNDLNAIAMQAWIDQNGGDSKTVRFLELTASLIPDAVASGRVDCGNLGNPILSGALATGKVRLLGRAFDAIAKRFMQAGYFANAEYVAKNRDMITRFRKVIETSAAYANEHHEQMAEVVSKFTGVDAKVIAAQTKQVVGTVIDLKLVQPMVDAAAEYHAIPSGFDARQMIDPAALS